jgi:sulfotransferase family protein
MKNNLLIIAGSGRSGTTWVLDALAEANNLRTIFEPLNSFFVPEARNFAHCYVREDAHEPELKRFMEKIFKGKYHNIWIDTRCYKANLIPSLSQITSLNGLYDFGAFYKVFLRRSLKYIREKSFVPITKFIRANLMLDWIEKNFYARIVFLVRHPGAVVASQIAASKREGGFAWDFSGQIKQGILSQYKKDEQLRKDFLDKYYEIFSEKLSLVAGHTLIWCIENILPIYNLQKKKRYVFFYEDIVNNPEKEFDHMVQLLGLERKPDRSIIVRPSQQASREMRNNSFEENRLTRWMKSFDQQQLDEINKVLKFFKVTTYSAYDPMPISRRQDSL